MSILSRPARFAHRGLATTTLLLAATAVAAVPHGTATAGTLVATAHVQSAGEIPSILAAAARPAFTPRDRRFFVEQLGLDAEQAQRLDQLLADYDAAFVAGLEGFRTAFRESRPPVGNAATRYRDEQVAMRQRMEQVLATARAEAARAGTEAEANAIIETAEKELEELREIMAERLEAFGPGAVEGRANVDRMLARMRELAADWSADRDRIGEELLRRVRSMLRPEQVDRWPAFERALVRRTLGLGRLSGEQVDLQAVLRETVPSEEVRALVAETLARWEQDLDVALRARNAALPRIESELRSLAVAAADDDEDAARRIRSVAARRVELHQAVRDITLGAAAAIERALPPGPAAEFIAAVHAQGFPSVERMLPFERLLTAAREREDLSDRERRELERLAEAYAAQRVGADAALRQATIATEPRELIASSGVMPRYDQSTPASAITNAERARRELGIRSAAAVRSLLGDERFAELPGARRWLR